MCSDVDEVQLLIRRDEATERAFQEIGREELAGVFPPARPGQGIGGVDNDDVPVLLHGIVLRVLSFRHEAADQGEDLARRHPAGKSVDDYHGVLHQGHRPSSEAVRYGGSKGDLFVHGHLPAVDFDQTIELSARRGLNGLSEGFIDVDINVDSEPRRGTHPPV